MKKIALAFLLFFDSSIWSEQNLTQISHQAEALWEARDDSAASQLFEKLPFQSLLDWQQARIQYNLGTIRLSQNQTKEALNDLQALTPTDLSLPRFGVNLFLNLGIAYWQYAQDLSASSSTLTLPQQALYIEQSLNAFKQAQALDCKLQAMEQDRSPFSCMSDLQIDAWRKKAENNLRAIHQELRKNLMDQASSIKEHIPLQQFDLNNDLLLLQDSVTVEDLQNLIEQIDQLPIEERLKQSLDSIKETLLLSLRKLENQHFSEARFFHFAASSELKSLLKEPPSTSLMILRQSVEQANRSLQLFLISQMIAEQSPQKRLIQTILSNQQQAILDNATLFIPSVLKEQAQLFRQANSGSSCQQSPWEQVIPLFAYGLQAAQNAQRQLNQPSSNPQEIAGQQSETLKNWQQALNLMLSPPPPSESSASKEMISSSRTAPQNLTETFRLIQEMYLEDQSQPPQKVQEFHSW